MITLPGSGVERRSTLQLVDWAYLESGIADLGAAGRRAALAVEPINLALRAEAEGDLVGRRYRQLLNSLAGPISLYFRSRPDPVPGETRGTDPGAPELKALASRDQQFSRELAQGRSVQRQTHLVVVWGNQGGELAEALKRWRRGRPGTGATVTGVELEQRCELVGTALSRMGCLTRRLGDGEWLAQVQELSGGHARGGPATFRSWIAPAQATVGPRLLKVDDCCCRSLYLATYPRTVSLGWLAPLLRGVGCELRVAAHVVPLPKLLTLNRLRRKIRSFETSLLVDHLRGRRSDRGTEAALDDAVRLEEKVLLEEERLFRLSVYATVVARSETALERSWQELLTALAELGCSVWPLSHRQVDGWRATLPSGSDPVGWGRELTSSALATTFPFLRRGLGQTRGVLLGPSVISRELVVLDPFDASHPNANVVVLGTSGAGKSYTTKLLAARLLLRGCQVRCVDPMGEYRRLAQALGGAVHELAPGQRSGLCALGGARAEGNPDPRARASRALEVTALLAAGPPPAWALADDEETALEECLVELFSEQEPVPTLTVLVERLVSSGHHRLARRLSRYTEGPWRGLFDGPPREGSDRDLGVYSLAALDRTRDQLLAPVMQMVLRAFEDEIARDPARPRLLVVDEAEVLLAQARSAAALEALSRRVRKLGAGLMVISQVVEDFLGSAVGNVIVRNCHTKVLLRQEEVALPAVRRSFGLSSAECELLRDAAPGAGLVLVGRERAAFQGAAPSEFQSWLTTDARPGGAGW